MAIHILGNGPSIRFFDRSAWPESDVFVGCNFSDTALRPDYTVIVDVQAVKKFRGGHAGYKLEIPAVLSDRAYKYLDKDSGGFHTLAPGHITVHDTMELIRDRSVSRNLAMNSAQHGAVYALTNHGDHQQLHIWGTDSFWSHDLESTTDAIVRPEQQGRRIRPIITDQWNRYWRKIFREYQTHEFIIHCPADSAVISGLTDYTNVSISREEA